MRKKYIVKLNERIIATTEFEKADPPMGVVTGKLIFHGIELSYKFFHNYCKNNNIIINFDDPENFAIATDSIEGLKVFAEDGTEIKGFGSIVEGFDDEGYEITVFGIAYPFYNREFSHHVEAYQNSFK